MRLVYRAMASREISSVDCEACRGRDMCGGPSVHQLEALRAGQKIKAWARHARPLTGQLMTILPLQPIGLQVP